MAARQPGFLEAYQSGAAAARAACCESGDGNTSHPAVQHYCRFMLAAALECTLVAIARAGEMCSTRANLAFTRSRHPSRADVRFEFDAAGLPVSCTIWIINSKARGAERLRKLPVPLPMAGRYLSPGLALYYLLHVIDPTPSFMAASIPLFRDPRTGRILTVTYIRSSLRSCMTAIGRDATVYGAHSLRIGGATALAFLHIPGDQIQAAGRWHSGAYLRYLRQTRGSALRNLTLVASAETDDMEADFVDIDAHGFDEDDDL